MSNVIELTDKELNELQALLLHYSTRKDRWTISTELKLAVARVGKKDPTIGFPWRMYNA